MIFPVAIESGRFRISQTTYHKLREFESFLAHEEKVNA
jgi:hypothetical protein